MANALATCAGAFAGRGGGDGGKPQLHFAVLNAIEATNLELIAAGTGLATTLAIVEVDGDRVRPCHVGDSAILLFGQRGKIKMQTIAHSPVGYAVEAGLLDAQQAIHHEHRHIISNIVGSPAMRIEIGPPSQMATFDTLLLASDGLLDNLHVNESGHRPQGTSLASRQRVGRTVAGPNGVA